MPIYEFKCKKCNNSIELIQKYDEKAPTCDKCGEILSRAVSRNSFRLKGGGWHEDGYSKGE